MQAIADFLIAFAASALWFVAVRRKLGAPAILVLPGAFAVWVAAILFGGWLHADLLSSAAPGASPGYRVYQGPLALSLAVAWQGLVALSARAIRRIVAWSRT